ncbi:MAG: protein phosphatase 2C domain-containing protein [Ruminococcus sp.]|nr:protein phosphatase 2C domain-containing protein [Ruminococcus sp.]
MKYNVIGHSEVGKRHLAAGGEVNQDCILLHNDERITAVALSDGATGAKDAARPAAEATVEACIEFAQNGKIWDMNKHALTEELLRVIDNHYLELDFPYDRLCATMVVLMINHISGTFITISIGDCAAMLLNKQLEPSILISPVNYFSKRNTLFANSSIANRFLKLERGSLTDTDISGFALITDGAEELMNASKNDEIRRLSALAVIDPDSGEKALKECIADLSERNNDDITAAFVMISDDEEIRAAAADELGLEYEDMYGSEPETPDQAEDEYVTDEESCTIPEEPETEEQDMVAESEKTLLGFLAEPRSPEELIFAGFINRPSDLLNLIYPYLKEGLVKYSDHHFVSVKGGR